MAKNTVKTGFTLMELLIVIAIIGILVSIAVASYTTTQKKSRDSRRLNDMKSVQNAWELYYADNGGIYPSGCTYSESITPTPGVMNSNYMPGGFPYEPKGSPLTTYPDLHPTEWSRCSTTTYCFCAGLETETNLTTDCLDDPATELNEGKTAASEGFGWKGLYCVKQLQ